MKIKIAKCVEPVVANGAAINWVMLIYFCSGLCSLIDEVVWVRLLKLTLGNTVYASSIVVSVFMAGLALGALVMGRHADRVRRRLRLYAILEVLATISALSLPGILRFADVVYRWFFTKYQPVPAELMLVQVILSAAILLVPAMVMGSTFPLLGRYVTALQNQVGHLVGRLYALNMLGAAAGCFLAGFVLIRLVGVIGTLFVAAAINMLVAIGGWVLSRLHDITGDSAVEVAAAGQVGVGPQQTGRARYYVLMSAFFVSGLISIGYELVWMRSIVFLSGGFTYVFSAVLTVYLLGNVVGAWIGSHLSRRLKLPAVGFGVSLSCLGTLGIFYIPWLSAWSSLGAGITGLLKARGEMAASAVFHSIFLFFVPAVMMGVGFPLALQAWGEYRREVGQTTGTVYGTNTIGAVLGGVVTGFVLIPMMGIKLSIMALGLIGIWVGVILLQVNLAAVSAGRRAAYLAVAVGLTIAAIAIPYQLFNQQSWISPGQTNVAMQEGITTTVIVKRNIDDGSLELTSDGVRIAGDDIHRSAQKTLGHLGPLLRSNAQDVLSVGFGSGETTMCLAQHNLNRIDCVEIAPELVQVALRFFKHINLGDQLSKKVNMIYMDAKNYLHLTPSHYDIIINDADTPGQSGSAPLFAKEHFRSAAEHLNQGGLFITKLHLVDITLSSFDSILGTFLQVYPHVTIWFPTTKPYIFFYLVGSHQKQLFSPKYIDEELAKEGVRDSVAYLNFHNSLDVLSCYIGDENDIERYLKKSFHINSDYSPYVEFDFRGGYSLIESGFFQEFIEAVRQSSLLNHIDWTGLSDPERDKWRSDYQLYYKVSSYVLNSHAQQNQVWIVLWNSFEGLRLMPRHAALLEQEDKSLLFVKDKLFSGRFDADKVKVLTDMDILLQQQPDFGAAWLIKSWALQQNNEMSRALDAAQKAVQHAPNTVAAHDNLGMVLVKLGQLDKAVDHYSRAIQLMPADMRLHRNLGTVFLRQGRVNDAVLQFRQALRIQPSSADLHFEMGYALAHLGRKDEAVAEYHEALRLNPWHADAHKSLDQMSAQ